MYSHENHILMFFNSGMSYIDEMIYELNECAKKIKIFLGKILKRICFDKFNDVANFICFFIFIKV